MKAHQEEGKKGSLKWIQEIVNVCPDYLNELVILNLNLKIPNIEWVSPLKSDGYAEYRDAHFLIKLGLEKYAAKLRNFWPERGPQWDTLGKGEKHYFILEAKANILEIFSSMQAKSKKSIGQIQGSFKETKQYLNCNNAQRWEQVFYQYATRVAHLYFLRHHCNVNAYLVFLYFLNDYTHIPTSRLEWDEAVKLQKQLMSLEKHKLQKYITSVYIDVNVLKIEQTNLPNHKERPF